MTNGYGRGSGFLPRAKVGKHKSTATDAADDVKRREAVYREGFNDGLACAIRVITAPSIEEAARRIEEAMK